MTLSILNSARMHFPSEVYDGCKYVKILLILYMVYASFNNSKDYVHVYKIMTIENKVKLHFCFFLLLFKLYSIDPK